MTPDTLVDTADTSAPNTLGITETPVVSGIAATCLDDSYRRQKRRSRELLFRPANVLLPIVDALTAATAATISTIWSPYINLAYSRPGVITYGEILIPLVILVLTVSHALGLHDLRRIFRTKAILKSSILMAVFSVVLLALSAYLLNYQLIGRKLLLMITTILLTGSFMSRVILGKLILSYQVNRCVVGDERYLFELNYFIKDLGSEGHVELPMTFNTSDRTNLFKFIEENSVDELIIDPRTDALSSREIQQLTFDGIRITPLPDYLAEQLKIVPIDRVDSQWLCYSLETSQPIYAFFKRMVDILGASIGLILTAPVLAIAAVLIKLESKGPIFYSQTRVGKFNQPFKIYKLRSMASDAERNGAQWAAVNDARVTRIGKILRKTRIDEIPQFWNVLRGEMSIVGPRPERPEFVSDLDQSIPYYLQRHLIAPGITGWAQINYPYGSSQKDAERKLMYDLYYVRYASISLDLHICLRTVTAIMQGSR
ncbi:MAG: exopolysaccharide biosynthesis polyprenyl glycosylphosphotransferase [Planctomycetota bacterium]